MTPPDIQTATARLRALAAPLRLRVTRDPEGWPMIPGRLGHLEWHTADTLAAYTRGAVTRRRLLAFPGGRRHQVGDQSVASWLRSTSSRPWRGFSGLGSASPPRPWTG
jgi:hypothetical protein